MSRFPAYPIFIFVLSLMLSGCVSYSRIVNDWPEELPPINLFIQAYEDDPENQEIQSMENYLSWVKRFYQGWVVYENGWLNMSENLVASVEEEKRSRAAEQIALLGKKIAPEWAKEKSDRYIFTDMVAVWGESLLEALDRGEVFEYMDSVERDLVLLEAGSIARKDISIQRYFPDIEEEPFFF